MISKKLVLILSLCVAGSLIPLQGAACVNTTLDVVLATNGGVCSIGAYTFDFNSFAIIGDTGVYTPPGGFTAADLNFTVVTDANGTGFELTPNVTISAGPGSGNVDSQLEYVVKSTLANNLDSMYLDVTGSTSGTAFDHIQEAYCLGYAVSPPGSAGFCPGAPAPFNPNEIDASINDGFAASATTTFSNQTAISVQKDIDVNGGSSGSATLTGVYQEFGPPVPEPGTYILSLIGLGLMFLGTRKYSRS